MSAADDSSTSNSRRRIRHNGGRRKQIYVRVTEDEHEKLAARAAASGLTVPSYLALAGMQSLAAGADGPSMTPPQARALVAELYAVKRILRGSSTNLNQLTKGANATGEIPPEAWHHAERIARMEQRLDDVLASIAPELKPRT
ncbi:plasmid mobilization protein [Saccharopolyspora griseoalba]|uniref:Mobilization protein n=1 Tax=Saccharopolyspora griseoalba TaxID=1431848 RepID=A0ABW2LUY1_9PSEU